MLTVCVHVCVLSRSQLSFFSAESFIFLKPVGGSLLPAWWGKGLDPSIWCNPLLGGPTLFWSWFLGSGVPVPYERLASSRSSACNSTEAESKTNFIRPWCHFLQSLCVGWKADKKCSDYSKNTADTWLLTCFIRSLRSNWMCLMLWDIVVRTTRSAICSFSSISSCFLFHSSIFQYACMSQKAACSRSQSWTHNKKRPHDYIVKMLHNPLSMLEVQKGEIRWKFLQVLRSARANFLTMSSSFVVFFLFPWRKKILKTMEEIL